MSNSVARSVSSALGIWLPLTWLANEPDEDDGEPLKARNSVSPEKVECVSGTLRFVVGDNPAKSSSPLAKAASVLPRARKKQVHHHREKERYWRTLACLS